MKEYIFETLIAMAFALLWAKLKQDDRDRVEQKQSRYIIEQRSSGAAAVVMAVLSAVPFIIVTGFRYKVGTDYGYYQSSFRLVVDGYTSYFKNPLYLLLEYITAFVSSKYIMMFVNITLITIGCYWVGIYQISTNPAYSILMFVLTNTYFITLNGVRQGLGMAVLFLGLVYVVREEPKKYYIAYLASVLFHKGMVIAFPIYIVAKYRISPKAAWIAVIGATGAALVLSGPLSSLLSWFGYDQYITGAAEDTFEAILALINIAILGVFCFYDRTARGTEYERLYNVLFWMQTIATAAIMMSISLPLAKRICWIFSIGQILSLPLFTKFETSKIGKVVLNGGIVILFGLSIYFGIVVNGAHKVYPYTWIWSVFDEIPE